MFEGEESEVNVLPKCGRPLRAPEGIRVRRATPQIVPCALDISEVVDAAAGARRSRPNPQGINFVWNEEARNFFVLGEGP